MEIYASLIDDDDFVALINESVPMWLKEFDEGTDKRLLWDLIKYRIRQVSIKYSKERALKKRKKISDLETSLKICEEKCNESPTFENQEEFEMLKMEYDRKRSHYSIKSHLVRERRKKQ